MTAILLTLLVLAAIGGLVAWIWLIAEVFRRGEKGWGMALIVATFVPIVGTLVQLAFLWMRRREYARPIRLVVGCSVLAVIVSFPLQRRAASAMEDALEAAASETVPSASDDSAPADNPTRNSTSNPTETASDAAPVNATVSATSIAKRPPWPAREDPRRPRSGPPKSTSAAVRTEPVSTATPEPDAAGTVTNRAAGDDLFSPTPAPKADPSRAELTVLGLGEPTGEALRSLRLRLANTAPQPIRELKLQLEYLDAKGSRMGEWTTVHRGSDTVVSANATNEFELHAFFVPAFAKDVRVRLLRIRYADDTEWPHGY